MSGRDLIIRGSAGGTSAPRSTFSEAPDTRANNQLVELVELLGAGPWKGPIVEGHPLQSVILDGTPMENADGQRNWTGDTEVKFAWGTPDQEAISGFRPPASETAVGVEVRADRPVVRQVNDTRLTALVVNLSCARLAKTSSENGSITGTRVDLAIDVSSAGGDYRQIGFCRFDDKASSGLSQSYRIVLNGTAGPWRVRVRRLTADATSSLVEDKIFWQSYARVIDYEYRYPGSVIMAGRFYAKDFNNQLPTRQVLCDRLIVQVPANYNPYTREYATTGPGTTGGVWDGSFKAEWSDNPVWCAKYVINDVNNGAGRFIKPSHLNKWELYQIAKWCDELVPDGFGGLEPRFTCNAEFKQREAAQKVISQLVGIFNAVAFAQAGGLGISADMPSTPSALFPNAIVENGEFRYQGTSQSARHTCAYVTWNNPDNMYQPEPEFVPLEAAVKRWGIIETEVVAIGCNSRGQAHRYGLWILLTEYLCDEVLTFRSGLHGAAVQVGEVFETVDISRAANGERFGGLIAAVSSDLLTVTLDEPVVIDPLKSVLLTVVLPDGTLHNGECMNPGSDEPVSELTLLAPLPEMPVDRAVWAVSVGDAVREQWRCLGVKSQGNAKYEITALKYTPEIHALVDAIKLDANGVIKNAIKRAEVHIESPESIAFTPSLIVGTTNYQVEVSWSRVVTAQSYRFLWRVAGGLWQTVETTSNAGEITSIGAGSQLEVKVIARNVFGQEASSVATYTVAAADLPVTAVGSVSNLQVQITGDRAAPQLSATWDITGAADHFVVETRYGDGPWLGAAEPTESHCVVSTAYGEVSLRVAPVTALTGSWATWSGNVNDMTIVPENVTGLALSNGATATTFAALDAVFAWTKQADADSYRIEMWSGATKLGDFTSATSDFTYTYALNTARKRALEIRVWGVNRGGESLAPATLAVTNPQIAAGVAGALRNSATSLMVTVALPQDSDYAGTLYVASTNALADPQSLTPLADAPSWSAIVPITPGAYGTWYFWAASYDKFGRDGLNWSPRGQIEVLELPEGIPSVSDASVITATTGSDAPGGSSYRVVYDIATKKAWTWHPELSPARYTKAVSAGDIEDKISDSQINDALLSRVAIGGQRNMVPPILQWVIASGGALIPFAPDAKRRDAGYASLPSSPSVVQVPYGSLVLKQNTTYTVGFLARSAVAASATVNIDFYPDDLPETQITVDPTLKPYSWTINTGSSANAGACALRFFNAIGDEVRIADVTLFEGSVAGQWSVSDAVIVATQSATAANTAALGSQATTLAGVAARLNSGGDIKEAIVTAQATAVATANKVAGKYSVAVDVNGYMSGWTAFNDGSFSSLKISADKVVFSPSSAVPDPEFQDPSYWHFDAAGWYTETGTPFANDVVGACVVAVLWSGTFAGTERRHIYTVVPRALPYQAGESFRLKAKGGNQSNQIIHCDVQFYSDAGGTTYVGGAGLSWLPGESGWRSTLGVVPTGARYFRTYIYNESGTAYSGGAGVAALSLSLAAGADMVVDGSITAPKMAAASVNTAALQAGAATIDKLATTAISAIRAYLTGVVAATIDLVSVDWSYIRTASKWWADTVDGWISAGQGSAGNYFQEFRASHGSALLIEQKAGGSTWGEVTYKLYFRDAANVERLIIDPASGIYKIKGRVEADDGYFAGSLSAASGTLGTITAGLLRNATNTTRFSLDETGSGALLAVNGVDRIWANGRTNWSNAIGEATYSVGLPVAKVEEVPAGFDDDGNAVYNTVSTYWLDAYLDTGIAVESLLDAYESSFFGNVTGWNMTYNGGAGWGAASMLTSVEVVKQVPVRGDETWGSARLYLRVYCVCRGTPSVAVGQSIVINTLTIKLFRRT